MVSLQELKEPEYIQTRIQLWDKFKAEREAELAAKVPQPIKVSLSIVYLPHKPEFLL